MNAPGRIRASISSSSPPVSLAVPYEGDRLKITGFDDVNPVVVINNYLHT